MELVFIRLFTTFINVKYNEEIIMKFKKRVLPAVIALLLGVSASAYAETDGWGSVASGELESGSFEGEDEPRLVTPAVASVTAENIPSKAACGEDDPRYSSIVPVLKELQAGKAIEPMQTSVNTYIALSDNVRKILADNVFISASDCSETHLFEGALIGKVNVPFTDILGLINTVMRTNDQGLINFLSNNVNASSESALSIVTMLQPIPFDDGQVRKLYAIMDPSKSLPDSKKMEVQKPLLLEVFLAFSGKVNADEKGKKVFMVTGINNYRNNIIKSMFLQGNGDARVGSEMEQEGIVSFVISLLGMAGLNSQIVSSDVTAKELATE